MHIELMRFPVMLLMLTALLAGACGRGTSSTSGPSPQGFEAKGRIVEIAPDGRRAVIAHEAVPNLMPAMTMTFDVADSSLLTGLVPGDAVSFDIAILNGAPLLTSMERQSSSNEDAVVETAEPGSLLEPSDESLYAFDAEWKDQDGRRTRLVSFGGRPILLSMVFTHCTYACPVTISDMKRLAAELPEDVRKDLRYVLVSLDPERDSPARLRRFAEGFGLDLNRWTLLTGGENDVRTLAALLGVKYREQSDGQIAHTSMITVLDESGEIVMQHMGLGNTEASASHIAELLAARGA